MAYGLLVMSALVLGLAPPAEGGGQDLLDLPDLGVAPVGPVGVSTGPAGIDVATDLDLVGVETGVDLPLLPGVSVEVAPGATAGQDPAAAPAGRAPEGPRAVDDLPPAAVAAGSSVLATLLGLALWVGARPALGLFSRIEDGDLASHPLRRQALDVIAANPGASVQDVRRALGIAWGTAIYHLGRLERAGLVAVRRAGGRSGHWPLGQAPSHDALPPTAKALADLVLGRPGLSQAELAVLAGIGAPAACKHLARLESAGLVTVERAGRTRLYRSTGRLDALLAA